MIKLKTAKHSRAFEAAISVGARLSGIIGVYIGFNSLLVEFGFISGDSDLMISLLILPILYILKDSYTFFEPYTVSAFYNDDKVSVTRGFFTKVTDTLDFVNVENTEIIQSLIGKHYKFATIKMYSPGGGVEVPFLFEYEKLLEYIESTKSKTK